MGLIKYALIMVVLFTQLLWSKADIVINGYDEYYFNCQLSYFEALPEISFDEVLKSKFDQKTSNRFSLGYKKNAVWFKIIIKNHTQTSQKMVLELSEMFYHTVDLYTVYNHKIYHEKNGLNVPISERDIKEINPSFMLHFKPEETKEIYLKLISDYSFFGEISLSEAQSFSKNTRIENNKYIYYFGAVLTIALYNLFLYLYLREKLYLYYLAYIFSFAIWVSLYRGFTFYFLDKETYDLLQISIPIFFVMLLLFTKETFRTKINFPIINTILIFFIQLLLLVSLVMLFYVHEGYCLMTYVVAPILPFLILTAIYAIIKGSKSALIYLLALLIFFIGMGSITLLSLGYIPYSIDTRNAPVVGSLFEITLFSLLLAYHINKFKAEKIVAQEKLIQQQRSEQNRLFHAVAEKTAALRQSKERLEKELEITQKLEEDLKRQATTDPLTGLMNRRALFTMCDKEINQASRYKYALSCMILDIDKFKNVNDTYGHDAGDIVLEYIAKQIHENIRTADYVGRIGGEEFAILMPSTEADSAYEIAERLRNKIDENKIVVGQHTVQVTVSIGISEIHTGESDTHDIMKRADDALYEAKETGRNRVCIHK